MHENEIREALNRHWAASDANDFDVEHDITERTHCSSTRNRASASRAGTTSGLRVAQPSSKRFKVRRIVGTSDLWVTEFILAYDGRPSYSVSIM